MSGHPHDLLFKRAFAQIDNARDELRAILPPELVRRIDFDRLEVKPSDFVDEALSELFSDILYKVALADEHLYVWVMLEHQSRSDERMGFRLLRYMVRVWDAILRDEPSRTRLPPIIPVVLQHDPNGWTASTRFASAYDVPAAVLAPIRAHLPDFEYLVDDLGTTTEEDLGDRTDSPYLKLVLWSLRAHGHAPQMERMEEWIECFRALRERRDRADLESLLRYHMQVSGEAGSEVIDAAAGADPQIKETFVSMYDRILEEGMKEGRHEGEVAVLAKQLGLKFGELPKWVHDRLMSGTHAEFERWTGKVLTAAKLDEVFVDD